MQFSRTSPATEADSDEATLLADDLVEDREASNTRSCNADLQGRTPLDQTIDRIGMGSYQWVLLTLCGFGWLADNMWLQTSSIILPRVQRHFSVPDQVIGTMSSVQIGGMMLGALCWGAYTDLIGRTSAFNATLFLTALFGICASLSNSFAVLCIMLFLLGTAVGGSMPTDGTLMLEHMPKGKDYLVIASGVYCSLGAVLAAVAALLILPAHSCDPAPEPCERAQNNGWKYMVLSLGILTLLMFVARMVFFQLHESPRYLVRTGRHEEAVAALQKISKFNGTELTLNVEDVMDYQSHTSDDIPLDTLAEQSKAYQPLSQGEGEALNVESKSITRSSRTTWQFVLRPLRAWGIQVRVLLSPRWRRTTLLVWGVNCSINGAYTLFNIYLPKLLEGRNIASDGHGMSLSDNLWGVLIYVTGGFPGSLLGAYMVDTRLGWRWSLASSTLVTALLSAAFIVLQHPWAVNTVSAGINLSSTTMWAILYGWMPAIFETEVRGTACGTAVAISRIVSMMAPVLGGILISVNVTIPVVVSIAVYILAAVFVLLMEDKDKRQRSNNPLNCTVVHP